jgi:hypothetical protein
VTNGGDDISDQAAKKSLRPTEHVRLPVLDTLPSAFQGLLKRKNKLPVGGVMVMLLVPLAVVIV